jgi:hypothetical protein
MRAGKKALVQAELFFGLRLSCKNEEMGKGGKEYRNTGVKE